MSVGKGGVAGGGGKSWIGILASYVVYRVAVDVYK